MMPSQTKTPDIFDYYAGLTDKLEGKTIPVSPTIFDYTVLEPFGVSAHIVPWNFPIAIRKITWSSC